MSRVCFVTGTTGMVGNNVSHSHRKTRRVFKPNLHKKTYWAESLGRKVSILVSKKGIKIIDKYGIDHVVSMAASRGNNI